MGFVVNKAIHQVSVTCYNILYNDNEYATLWEYLLDISVCSVYAV